MRQGRKEAVTDWEDEGREKLNKQETRVKDTMRYTYNEIVKSKISDHDDGENGKIQGDEAVREAKEKKKT